MSSSSLGDKQQCERVKSKQRRKQQKKVKWRREKANLSSWAEWGGGRKLQWSETESVWPTRESTERINIKFTNRKMLSSSYIISLFIKSKRARQAGLLKISTSRMLALWYLLVSSVILRCTSIAERNGKVWRTFSLSWWDFPIFQFVSAAQAAQVLKWNWVNKWNPSGQSAV